MQKNRIFLYVLMVVLFVGLLFYHGGAEGAETQYIDPLALPWLDSQEDVLGILDTTYGPAETHGYWHFDCDDTNFCQPYYLEGQTPVKADILFYFDGDDRLRGVQATYSNDMYNTLIKRVRQDFENGGWISYGTKMVHVYEKEIDNAIVEVEIEYDVEKKEFVFISTIKASGESKHEPKIKSRPDMLYSRTLLFTDRSC